MDVTQSTWFISLQCFFEKLSTALSHEACNGIRPYAIILAKDMAFYGGTDELVGGVLPSMTKLCGEEGGLEQEQAAGLCVSSKSSSSFTAGSPEVEVRFRISGEKLVLTRSGGSAQDQRKQVADQRRCLKYWVHLYREDGVEVDYMRPLPEEVSSLSALISDTTVWEIDGTVFKRSGGNAQEQRKQAADRLLCPKYRVRLYYEDNTEVDYTRPLKEEASSLSVRIINGTAWENEVDQWSRDAEQMGAAIKKLAEQTTRGEERWGNQDAFFDLVEAVEKVVAQLEGRSTRGAHADSRKQLLMDEVASFLEEEAANYNLLEDFISEFRKAWMVDDC